MHQALWCCLVLYQRSNSEVPDAERCTTSLLVNIICKLAVRTCCTSMLYKDAMLCCIAHEIEGSVLSVVVALLSFDKCRPLLARTLDSLKQGWQHDPALGKALLTRLLQDLQAVTSAKSAVSAEGVKRFMRLCSCMEAIVSGCGPRIGVDLPGNMATVHTMPLDCAVFNDWTVLFPQSDADLTKVASWAVNCTVVMLDMFEHHAAVNVGLLGICVSTASAGHLCFYCSQGNQYISGQANTVCVPKRFLDLQSCLDNGYQACTRAMTSSMRYPSGLQHRQAQRWSSSVPTYSMPLQLL